MGRGLPSTKVVQAVAEAENRNPSELGPPLYEVIDPERSHSSNHLDAQDDRVVIVREAPADYGAFRSPGEK